jgi:threonine dehydrogenase-like Zn-dependent dehydrogenase
MRQQLAAAVGGRFLVVDADSDTISAVGSPVVIEATGSPEAVAVAVRTAGEDGRIVLLGSPRGVTSRFPHDEIRVKRLRLAGAQVNTLDLGSARTGGTSRRREAMRFLDLLGTGRIAVDDLVGPSIDPTEARPGSLSVRTPSASEASIEPARVPQRPAVRTRSGQRRARCTAILGRRRRSLTGTAARRGW